jgi:predicted nucleotidyltransferase
VTKTGPIYPTRTEYSQVRLKELSERLATLQEVSSFPGLTIFCAGSYARLEASEYSDIDMFFLRPGKEKITTDLNTRSLRLWGSLIHLVQEMGFPQFSNDCEYLKLLNTEDMQMKLGSRMDDQENYFTVRMLLLLESHCLHGQAVFDEAISSIVGSYFKDFPDHPETFQPIFLLNDISRFWKTMLLNYENKRSMPDGTADDLEARKTRHKVRNFKLKYSRMTTCFASIAALGSHPTPVTEQHVVELTRMTPHKRLESVPEHIAATKSVVEAVLREYDWFLEMTGLPTPDLERRFSDKQKRTELFGRAAKYGDAMFKLLQTIDDSNPERRLLRTVVI